MKNIKILFVDDEKCVINAIKNILIDYTIVTETNAFNAIKLCRRERFDIIIVDYRMPVIDGIEVFEEIREIQESNDLFAAHTDNKNPTKTECIKILATASGTTYLFKDELKNDLFHYFLEKPVDARKLIQLIQKTIYTLNPERKALLYEE